MLPQGGQGGLRNTPSGGGPAPEAHTLGTASSPEVRTTHRSLPSTAGQNPGPKARAYAGLNFCTGVVLLPGLKETKHTEYRGGGSSLIIMKDLANKKLEGQR